MHDTRGNDNHVTCRDANTQADSHPHDHRAQLRFLMIGTHEGFVLKPWSKRKWPEGGEVNFRCCGGDREEMGTGMLTEVAEGKMESGRPSSHLIVLGPVTRKTHLLQLTDKAIKHKAL